MTYFARKYCALMVSAVKAGEGEPEAALIAEIVFSAFIF